MSIKSIVYASLGIVGDGTTKTITVNFATAPFILAAFGTLPGSAPEMSKAFTLGSLLPTAISDVTSNAESPDVTASLGILGNVTFTFDDAPANNEKVTIYCILRF